jgi:hypothetical protein
VTSSAVMSHRECQRGTCATEQDGRLGAVRPASSDSTLAIAPSWLGEPAVPICWPAPALRQSSPGRLRRQLPEVLHSYGGAAGGPHGAGRNATNFAPVTPLFDKSLAIFYYWNVAVPGHSQSRSDLHWSLAPRPVAHLFDWDREYRRAGIKGRQILVSQKWASIPPRLALAAVAVYRRVIEACPQTV